MSLSANEAKRYARHIVLKGIGGQGQQKLKNARVLIIGAGGLGSPIIAYLAAAGIGTIGIIDNDEVSLSNLQRQVIHTSAGVGKSKVLSAKEFALSLNPEICINIYNERIESENANRLIADYDMVIDGCDSFATRLVVSKAAQDEKKYLIAGGVSMFDGHVSVFAPHLKNSNGKNNPSFRDLYPDVPNNVNLPACEETGVLGAITGVIGTLMAMEAIKLIVDIGEPLIGRLMLYDGANAKFSELTYS